MFIYMVNVVYLKYLGNGFFHKNLMILKSRTSADLKRRADKIKNSHLWYDKDWNL
jgi:hypothetical protein